MNFYDLVEEVWYSWRLGIATLRGVWSFPVLVRDYRRGTPYAIRTDLKGSGSIYLSTIELQWELRADCLG
jgi:hypothetical protein